MRARLRFHNHVVAALLSLLLGLPAFAQDAAKLDDMFARLKSADEAASARIESEIMLELSKSGSPAMDLLLKRGSDAMDAGNLDAAIDHLSAAIDHDQDFTEALSMRAMALYTEGEIGPALGDLAEVLTQEPRHFVAWTMLGTILEETEQPQRALDAFRRAAAIHPHITEVNEAVTRLENQLDGQEL